MEIENKKWIALTLFLISLGFFSLLIHYPPKLYWDESIHERGAEKILEGKGPYKDQMHPPLGREILVVSLYFFGESPAGGRGLSVIAGAGCVALIFLIGVQLTQSLFPSLLPPLLLLSDPLFYLHARMGMLD